MGLPLVVAVTSASVQDRAGGRAILARLAAGFRTVSLVWADGGYANCVDSTLLSWACGALNIIVVIVCGPPMSPSLGGRARRGACGAGAPA
ncbi:hypothetical protein [Streptomyces sp. NPDC088246]|uniref:hypothetical protein n=1 Tax=Streptomyces sp. NPDC088246 TaxID=3365842 RepID=UPI003821FADF